MFADFEHELQFLRVVKPLSIFGGTVRSSSPTGGQSRSTAAHDHHSRQCSSPEPVMTEPHHHHIAEPNSVLSNASSHARPIRKQQIQSEAAAASQAASSSTNSVSRSFSDLDSHSFIMWTGTLCALRTAAQQPLNLALTRQQTCTVAANMSMWQIVKEICKREGGAMRGLGQGMMPLVAGCAISEALYLGLYESSREALPMESQVTRDSTAAYFSDVCCRMVHVPLSVIAYRQMTQNNGFGQNSSQVPRPMSARATCRALYQEGGIRSVFAGLGSTLVIGCQWTAVWWVMYNQSKEFLYTRLDPFLVDSEGREGRNRTLKERLLQKGDNTLVNSAASVVTSAATALIFNPFLVLRTRLQVTPCGRLVPIARAIRAESGLLGFYAGARLNVLSCVIDGFLASTSYECAKLWSDRTANAPLSDEPK